MDQRELNKEAANTIEEVQPSLAKIIRELVEKGESPKRIKIVTKSVAGDGLITQLVESAAYHYRRQMDDELIYCWSVSTGEDVCENCTDQLEEEDGSSKV